MVFAPGRVCGRNSGVECQLPKLDVTGSNPVARSERIRRGTTRVTGPLFAFSYVEPHRKGSRRALPAVVTLAISSLVVSGPTPLRVLRVTPEERAPATTTISVTFDRPVAGALDASVDPARIFTISPAVAGRLEWRDPITLRLTPAAPLNPATEYTVTGSNDFAAMDGSKLEQPSTFTF